MSSFDNHIPIHLPFNIYIYRHWKESERVSNTARLIAHLLCPVQVIDYGIDEVNCAYFDPDESVLLYPHDGPITPPPSIGDFKSLIVVDGTWKQVRKMMGRIPQLKTLRRMNVDAQDPPYPRLRSPSVPGGLSTVEAMGSALLHFGFKDAEARLKEANWSLLNSLRQSVGIRHPLVPGLSFTDLRKLDNQYEI
ncbi:MAG: DTW domain-containing protein [Myxococcota bacterium]